jgi:hypothetical protein
VSKRIALLLLLAAGAALAAGAVVASASSSSPSGERIIGGSGDHGGVVVEPVYDDMTREIRYVSTPRGTPDPVKSNPIAAAPFYLPVYPVGSTVPSSFTLNCLDVPVENCPDHGQAVADAAKAIMPGVYGGGVVGHDHLMAGPGSHGDFNIARARSRLPSTATRRSRSRSTARTGRRISRSTARSCRPPSTGTACSSQAELGRSGVLRGCRGTPDAHSRGGGTRTPGLRFWRPPLYQLSYAPGLPRDCSPLDRAPPDYASARAAARARRTLPRDRRRARRRLGGGVHRLGWRRRTLRRRVRRPRPRGLARLDGHCRAPALRKSPGRTVFSIS